MARLSHLSLQFFLSWICFVGVAVGREAVVGGYKAAAGQFPYQVSVQIPNFGHDCGGGIIGDRFVLTAAHCVIEFDNHFSNERFYVVVGTTDRNKTDYRIDVVKMYVLAKYDRNSENSSEDIAVLKLKRRLEFSKRVKKLELPQDSKESYIGKTAMIAGWGWEWVKIHNGEIEDGGTSDTQLRFAEVIIIDSCHKLYDKNTIADKEICARVKGDGSNGPSGLCHGDSGSILVYRNTAIGVLSTSPWDCSEKTDSTLYARISHYLDFIHDAMNDRPNHDIRAKVIH